MYIIIIYQYMTKRFEAATAMALQSRDPISSMVSSLYFVKLQHKFILNLHLIFRTEYLKRIGNRTEAKRCHDADEELISSLEKCALDGSLKQWKNKVTATLQFIFIIYPSNL